MKRFLIFALIAAFVLAAGVASAKEVTMQGQFEVGAEWTDNENFFDQETDGGQEDDFNIEERARMYFNYVDSENLKGVIGFEVNADWGSGAGAKGTDAVGVQLKHAYVDFNWPDTALNIRGGLQGLAMPAAVAGSPVLDDDVAALIASYPVNDNVTVVAGWTRLVDANTGSDAQDNASQDEIDAFALIVPITMDGFKFTPWALYGQHGKDAAADAATGQGGAALTGLQGINATGNLNDTLDLWWLGGSFTMTALDPIVLAADLIYGQVDGDNASQNDREGWFFTAIAQYKMDAVTPGLFFAYGTGEDDDPNNGSEVMPTLGGVYAPTSFAFDGSGPRGTGNMLSGGGTELSVMVIGLGLYDFSFLEGLNHTARIAYGVGTNDSDLTKNWEGNLNANRGAQAGVMATDEDSFWEINFDTTYSLYEALTAYVQFGYIDLDLDEDSHPGINTDKLENAYKLLLALKYSY